LLPCSHSYYAYRLGGETTGSNTSETNTLSIGQFDDDPRLQVLEKEWFSQKKGLDIGCNEGVLTVQIG
jgi:ribosomal protein L11 methylase PrmA